MTLIGNRVLLRYALCASSGPHPARGPVGANSLHVLDPGSVPLRALLSGDVGGRETGRAHGYHPSRPPATASDGRPVFGPARWRVVSLARWPGGQVQPWRYRRM